MPPAGRLVGVATSDCYSGILGTFIPATRDVGIGVATELVLTVVVGDVTSPCRAPVATLK